MRSGGPKARADLANVLTMLSDTRNEIPKPQVRVLKHAKRYGSPKSYKYSQENVIWVEGG